MAPAVVDPELIRELSEVLLDKSPLQWHLLMRCWKMNLIPGSTTWWAPYLFRVGSLFLWAARLRKTNGPNFFWPLMNFAGIGPEKWVQKVGYLYQGRPIDIKTREQLLATIRPKHREFIPNEGPDADLITPMTSAL
jgi:hypothetical protein